MIKKTIMLGLLIAAGLASQTTLASDYDRNECTRLHIQIANMGSETCLLIDSQLLHGNTLESAPMTILPGRSKRFDVLQTFYGPDMVLKYQCGDKIVEFESQQNACIFWGGRTHATVLNKDEGIAIQSTNEGGSALWSRPGMINWTISND